MKRPTLSALVAAFALPLSLAAQTYVVTDLGTIGTNTSFATAINNAGQVCGYAQSATNAARAWRYTPGVGLVDLGSFGGADNRALAINGAGQVAGYSTDAGGVAHGFKFSGGSLLDIGGTGGGTNIFPQAINTAGNISGFTSISGTTQPFLYSSNNFSLLGTIIGAGQPATASAFGVNDAGRVVGVGSWQNGFQHAFRSDANGANIQDLGTLGGDESSAAAINTAGQVVGTAQPITGDSHAFLFSDGAGMADLGTLGGIGSDALALNNIGAVVGSSQIANLDVHAFAWTAGNGMRDLNNFIPVNAGWVLTEAVGVNDLGQIVGNGLLNGQPRAFLLTPFSGADTNPPVALATADTITNVTSFAGFITVNFWDDSKVAVASIATNCIRVTGPNGFDQVASLYPGPIAPPYTPLITNDALAIVRYFYVLPPNGIWNGTNNGVYSVSVEPGFVRDTLSNTMPATVIGSFIVATELTPAASISGTFTATMGEASNYIFSARSGVPYDASDVFVFHIDWNNDGLDLQNVTNTSGVAVSHVFTSIGTHSVRVTATDPHGLTSPAAFWTVFVSNPTPPQQWAAAPAMLTVRRQAIGINSNGTLLVAAGLPVKSNVGQVQSLAPGAVTWVDEHRLPAATTGLGAGMDSLNRIVFFGGINPATTTPLLTGFVYTPAAGQTTAIANKHFAVQSFAFCVDTQHRLYSIGGSTNASLTGAASTAVERYDGVANTWTTLAPMPSSRVQANATYDGLGHILVFGGYDPATGLMTQTIFSYDIAGDTWTQVASSIPNSVANRAVVLGADGMIYSIGGEVPGLTGAATAATYIYDPRINIWLTGPNLIQARSSTAATLGNDGFIYVIGGDNSGVGGNNGLTTVEKLDTATLTSPQILTAPFGSVMATSNYVFQFIASGNPRPTFSLPIAPAGMTINATNGILTWTPTTNQVGGNNVTVRATNSQGAGEEAFGITVLPLPVIGDTNPPTTPTNFFMFAHTATTVTMTWSAATDDVGVHHYQLWKFFRGGRGNPGRYAVLINNITNRSATALGSGSYRVNAVDAAGNQSPLTPAVAALTVQVPNVYHVIASEPNTLIQGSGFLYTIAASASPSPGFTTFSGPAGMTFTPIAGPLANNAYVVVQWQPTAGQVGTTSFTATATNENATANTTFSVVVLPGATDLVPPTPVALLTASGIANDRCNLAWTPAGDNVGVVNYHLVATHFGATSNHIVTLDVSGANTNTVLTGLLAASGYTIAITASDAAGNVSQPTSIFLTTLVQPNVTLHLARGGAPGTLDLNWNGFGTQWKFTLENSGSLTTPNWQPVAPTNQWPSTATNVVVTPNAAAPQGYYRVNATPAQP